jgi:fibronectin-binding autotransporter adhesin
MKNLRVTLLGLGLAGFALIAAGSLQAATNIWDGDTDGNWSTNANWVGDAAISAGDRLVFTNNTANTTVTNDISDGFLVNGIQFVSTNHGDNFTLAGANGITINRSIDAELPPDVASGGDIVVNDTIALDIDVSGNRTINAKARTSGGVGNREYHHLTFDGAISGARLTKSGGATLTLGGANVNSGFYVSGGVLAVNHNDALGGAGADNRLRATGATLQVNDGITVNGPLTIHNDGNNKVLRLENGAANIGGFAGTLTLSEAASGNFDISANASGGNFNFDQVFTVSGHITGTGFAANENAIVLVSDGVVALSNPTNDFVGRINLNHAGATLQIDDDGALSDALIILNQGDTKIRLPNGVTVDNTLQYNSNGGRKQLRLMGMSGNAATWSGPVNVNETTDGHFDVILNGTGTAGSNGTNNDPTQVLTISGKITSTAGAGVEILGDGIARLSNAANDITGNIRVNHNGSTLRIADGGALASSGANTILLQQGNTWLELEDGVTVGTQSTLQLNDAGNHGLKLYDAQNGIAESATFGGTIRTDETNVDQARFVVADSTDTLTLTGLIRDHSAATADIGTRGDGTIVLNGSVANTFSGEIRLGDGGQSTWDGTSGSKQGFVVVHRADALGTGNLNGNGSQLQAAVTDLYIPNDIVFSGGGLRLGGTNNFALSGDVTVTGTDVIGHYGLEGMTNTFSGNIDVTGTGTLKLDGANNLDNGTLVLNGTISGAGGGNLELDYTFSFADLYLNGTNTYTGRTRLEQGTTHVYQEANLGANPAAFDNDALDLSPNEPCTLHVTDTFSIDDANRGIRLGGNAGDDTIDVGATKTLTIGSANVVSDNGTVLYDFVKAGGGTLILQAPNTYTLDTRIDAGTLVLDNGAAIADTAGVIISNTVGALLRLDASETIGSLSGGGAAGGNVNLQANMLTVGDASDTTYAGVISGGGGLLKKGGGTLTLTGANALTGLTTVNTGRLELVGSVGGDLTVQDDGTLGGEGSTVGTLKLGSTTGAKIAVDGSNGSTAFSTLNLDVGSGTQTVILETEPSVPGVFNVVNYSGSVTAGGPANFTLQNAATYRSATFADSGTAITLDIGTVSNTWAGTTDSIWEIAGAKANWNNATDMVYREGDVVVFDDTAGNKTVTVTGANVVPNSVTFNNTAAGGAYTLGSAAGETITAVNGVRFIGSGDADVSSIIAGATAVTVGGTGTNTLSGVSTFTGGVTVQSGATLADGTPTTGDSRILGSLAQGSVLTIENGATLDINGNRDYKDYGTGSIIVSGAGVGGSGAIVNSGANAANAFHSEIILAGDTTIGGDYRIDIDNTVQTSASGITITKIGANQFTLAGNNSAASISNFVVNAGTLSLENNDAAASADIAVNSGASLKSWGNRQFANDVTLNGGSVGLLNDAVARYDGTVDVTAESTIHTADDDGRTVELAGSLTGSGKLNIARGTTLLSGDMSGYTGTFSLNAYRSRLDLVDGVNTPAGVELVNQNDQKRLRLVTGATNATVSGDVYIETNGDGRFDVVVVDAGATLTLSGGISGDGNDTGLDKLGAGSLVLAGTNTYTSRTLVSAGTLQIGDGGTSGTLGGGTVNVNGGDLVLNRSDGVSHSYDINFMGASNLMRAMAGTNDITTADNQAIDIRNLTIWTADSGAELNVNNSTGANGDNLGTSGSVTLRLEGAGDGSLERYVSEGGGDVTVIKDGAGMWTLERTYSGGNGWTGGGLIISNGTIAAGVDDCISYGTADRGDVTVDSNGTLDLLDRSVNVNGLLGDGVVDNSGGSAATLTVGNADVSSSFAGTLQDSGAGTLDLRKEGIGTQILSGTNTYSGTTRVVDGLLRAGSTGAISSGSAVTVTGTAFLMLDGYSQTIGSLAGGGAISNGSATAVTLTAGGDNTSTTFSGNMQDGAVGTLSYTKVGSGTNTLSGANALAGITAVDGGRLDLTGSVVGALTVAGSTTLGGEGIAASITLASGSTLAIDGSNGTTALTATGNLDVSGGTVTVVLETAPTVAGTFTVINYGGTFIGPIGNFVLQDAGDYRTPTFTDTGTAITLTISSQSYIWNNAEGNGQWDVNSSTNWTSTDGKFYDGDAVAFTNTLAETVTLFDDVLPASVAFTNTGTVTLNSDAVEALTATGGISLIDSGNVVVNSVIAGATPITLSGAGFLRLDGANTFTGGTVVESGATLRGGNNQALGDTGQATALTIQDGGTFDIRGNFNFESYAAGSILVKGAGVGGSGAIGNWGGADANEAFHDEIIFDGDTTIGGIRRFEIDGSLDTTVAADLTDGVEITCKSSNTLVLRGDQVGAKIKRWILDGTYVTITHDNALKSSDADGLADVTLNANTLNFYRTANGTHTFDNDMLFNGGTLRTAGNGGEDFALGGGWNVASNFTLETTKPTTLSGTLTGGGTVTKIGGSTLILDYGVGSSTHTGAWVLNNNTTRTDSPDAFTVNNAVTVGDTGADTLNLNGNSQTIGSLAGVGRVENTNATAVTLTTGGDNTSTTFSGVLRETGVGAAISLVKNGTGTNILSGANTYDGTTTVSAGGLRFNGDSSGATGTMTVAAAGILGGTGTFGGDMAVNGTLQPGSASVESLVAGSLSFSNGSTFAYEINSGGVNADMVIVTNLDLAGTVTLTMSDRDTTPVAVPDGTTFTLINYSGAWNSGLFMYDGTTLADGDQFIAAGSYWEIDYDAVAGGVNYAGDQVAGFFVNIQAIAGSDTWDGDVDGNWSVDNNWVDDTAPSTNSFLTFDGSVNTTTTNDIVDGLMLSGIQFAATNSGHNFTLDGDSITLAGNIDVTIPADAYTARDEIALDIDVSGTRDIYARASGSRKHDLIITGVITGDRFRKQGGSVLTVSNANTHAGFEVDVGVLAVHHGDALGTDNTLDNTGATLEIKDGVTVNGPLTISNTGNNKVVRLESGAANTGDYAGTITLNEGDSGNFDLNANATGGDWNFGQELTISGKVTGNGFAASENAIELRGDGVSQLTNPNNDFRGNISVFNSGATLRVSDDAPLGDAVVKLNGTNTKLQLTDGADVDNVLQINNANDRKQLRLAGDGGNAAIWSGPVNVNETANGNFEIVLNGTAQNGDGGTNNDPTQVLTISGKITSTAGAGVELRGDGVLVLNNPTNDITGNINILGNGSTLRIVDGGALDSSGSNLTILNTGRTWLELADGVSVGAQSALQINNEGQNHGLRIYDAVNGVAESASFAGDISVREPDAWQAQLWVADPEDTLTLTGVISENAAGRRLTTIGDGTVVFNGSAANTFSFFRLGDGSSSTWDGVDNGNPNGFVVVHRSDALGTGMITSVGGQLQAGTTGINIPNDIEIDGGGLRFGGANSFEVSGDILRDSGGGVGHYGLEGVTVTLSGNINMNNTTLTLEGSNTKDNGAFIFSGIISNSSADFIINDNFDNGDVTLSGVNTYEGKTQLEIGTLHIGQEANLGAVPALFDDDHLDLWGGTTLHVTNTMSVSATRGIDINNAEPVIEVDGSKTLTVLAPIRENTNGRLVKTGDGTMVLAGTNAYDGTTTIWAGLLVADNGEAIMDTAAVVISNAASAGLRLDDDETVGSLAGGGATGGDVNLQANTLTAGDANDTTYAGVISGSGGALTKEGSGRLTLSAASTLDGTTTVNDGRLELTGSVGGALTVTDGGTLGGEGSCAGVLTLGSAGGTSIAIDGSNETTAFTAGGGLDSSFGMQTVILEVPAPTGGTFTVINYSGTRTRTNPGAGDFQLQDAGSYNNPVFVDTGSAITLTIVAGDYTWDNAEGNGLWDINTSTNWTSTSKKFYDGDAVTFTNMGAEVVALAASVEPASVTFSNTTGNTYTLNDNGGDETLTAGNGITVAESGDVTINAEITGVTPVIHDGTGDLTLSVSNSFTEGITVKAGATLKAAGAAHPTESKVLGTTSQATAVTVESGGTFDVNGNRRFKTYGAGSIRVSGTGVGGNGAIVNTGASGNNAFSTQINLLGDTTIGGTARFDIDGTIMTSASGVTVTKVGGSQVVLAGNNDSASISNLVVDSGILQFENHDGGGNALVTVNPTGILRAWIGADGTRRVDNDVVLDGGEINGIGTRTTARYDGTVNVTADSVIDPNSNQRTIELAGSLTGSGTIDFGNGTNKLSGSTAGYTGRMNLRDGNTRLLLDGNGHAIGSLASANANTSVRNLSATPATLTVGADNTSDGDFTGVLEDGTGSAAFSLAKTGAGTQTLSGVNTYSGTTTINGGMLLINGDCSAVSNVVTVAAGGTLGGTEQIGGDVTVNGGTVAPGTSVESLLTGALGLQNGSTFAAELDSSAAAAVGADLLVAAGDLDLSGTVTLTLTDIAGPTTALPTNTVFTLINYAGAWNSGLFSVGGATVSDGGRFLAGGYWCEIDYDAAAGGPNYAGDQVAGSFVNITLQGQPATIFMLR